MIKQLSIHVWYRFSVIVSYVFILGNKSCFNSVPIPHYYFFFVMIVECFLKTIQFLTCNTRQTHKSHCYTKMRDFRKYFQT